VEVLGLFVRLTNDCVLPGGRRAEKGQEVYVPKDAVVSEMAYNTIMANDKTERVF
jgi:hypothetical protein